IVLTMGPFLAFLQPLFYDRHQARSNARVIVFLSLASLVAFFGLHLNVLVLGKTVQVDHFGSNFQSVSAYSLSAICFVLFLIILDLVQRRLQTLPSTFSILRRHLNQAVALLICILISLHLIFNLPLYRKGHVRRDLEPYEKLGSNYRSAFVDL